jgi:phosphoserine aminotransferase
MTRNFSAGPGALPREVLLEVQQAVVEMPGAGVSILGLGHRTALFRAILDETEERLRRLLEIPSDFHVLFLQGGGTLQFSMVPMAMLGEGKFADYLVTGYWSRKAVDAARCHGGVRVAWSGEQDGYDRLPTAADRPASPDSAYLFYVSNETVEGLQFRSCPRTPAPLVCDMSSDFLTRPVDLSPYSLVFAHAQKNLGPAGVTVVLVRDDVIERAPTGLPPILDYRAHAQARSLLHTPPVFAIYVVLLTLRWLEQRVGGLGRMADLNAEKAGIVRDALRDCAQFYKRDVRPEFESDVNLAFRCPTPELDRRFVARAEREGLLGLEGHRSRGGLRISLFNAVTRDDARAAATFIRDFASRSGVGSR